ncbi:MAG: flagellar hook-associated protein FlgK, partial [Planctomycetota bacterium]
MSLFGTIQQSNGALQAMQIGLQVAGNNISNANTEGYIRQEINLTPASAFRNGNLIQGHGVRVTGITQAIDKALAERMFQANTAAAGGETLEKAYNQLEELAQELDGNGLNNQLSEFNNALHELSTQPADQSVRDFVVLQGEALAGKLRTTREQALDRQQAWNADLAGIATQINRLTERISRLNTEIATIEGGGLLGSDATGLRDQRYQDLEELAGYIDINIQEQSSGNVNVFVGGDYLVSNGSYREVYSVYDEGEGGQEVRIRETDSPLDTQSGILAATVEARNSVFGDYIDELDDVASAL